MFVGGGFTPDHAKRAHNVDMFNHNHDNIAEAHNLCRIQPDLASLEGFSALRVYIDGGIYLHFIPLILLIIDSERPLGAS